VNAEVSEGAERRRLSRTERLVAARMEQSRQTIPQFTVRRDVDMAAALGARGEASVNDLVVRACALALREHPRLNATVDGDELVLYQRVHGGVAVDADGLLVVPVVRDADGGTLVELSAASRDLVTRARARELTPADMDGATFTVSNLGMLGVDDFDAIVSPGQAAILAVGALRGDPPRLTLRLTSDHRIVYGAQAARFLGRIAELLEAPGELV
jgi:pyruvate dehydrogenase E2 component (dihydrolipoamide acetyltransferase)